MREGEAIELPGGTHEPRPLGGLERIQRRRRLDPDRVGEDVCVELRADDRCDGQDIGRRLRQPAEPPADDVAHPRA